MSDTAIILLMYRVPSYIRVTFGLEERDDGNWTGLRGTALVREGGTIPTEGIKNYLILWDRFSYYESAVSDMRAQLQSINPGCVVMSVAVQA